jgi:hypothetical protein
MSASARTLFSLRELAGNNNIGFAVIASAAKQSIEQQAEEWIASLRSQ